MNGIKFEWRYDTKDGRPAFCVWFREYFIAFGFGLTASTAYVAEQIIPKAAYALWSKVHEPAILTQRAKEHLKRLEAHEESIEEILSFGHWLRRKEAWRTRFTNVLTQAYLDFVRATIGNFDKAR